MKKIICLSLLTILALITLLTSCESKEGESMDSNNSTFSSNESKIDDASLDDVSLDLSTLSQETSSDEIDVEAIVSDVYEKILTHKDIFEDRLKYIEAPEPIDDQYEYVIVDDDRFKSFQDILDFFKTFLPADEAENNIRMLTIPFDEVNPAFYVEKDGVLYKLGDPGLIDIIFLYWVYEEAKMEMKDDGSIFVTVPTKSKPDTTYTLDYYFIIINNGENWVIKEFNVYVDYT